MKRIVIPILLFLVTTDRQKNSGSKKGSHLSDNFPGYSTFVFPQTDYMGKDITKKLVGQPLFKQIIKMLPQEPFDMLEVILTFSVC